MVLAEKHMIPRVLAAVIRVASVPRSLVAVEAGAVGPSKDCAYEGPFLKAITGIPIAMEGRTAACAHLSPIGNISQAVCDCWSNESVQNVQLLSGRAPVMSLEQLVYDCRLMNEVLAGTVSEVRRFRDWLAASDSRLDPQAYVLRPDVVLRLSERIAGAADPYRRTLVAVAGALAELRAGLAAAELELDRRELPWLDRLERALGELPETGEEMVERMQGRPCTDYSPEEYGL
jgi:methanol--5-hydroxybenzimidazolylcobamide Co-methyltransferase